jgi:biopolymer transport protein TolR
MAGLSLGSGRVVTEPNVIPMIDILLVLLIIHMIAGVRQVIPVQVPPLSSRPASSAPPIVLELLPGAGYAINGESVADSLLETVLATIYRERAAKLLFIKAAPDRSYMEVVAAFDRARGAGIQVLGLMPGGR